MKKYKIRVKNSYYYYKNRKNKMRRIFIVLIICSIITGIFFMTGRLDKAVIEMTQISPESSKQDQNKNSPVYFDGSEINYHLYRLPKVVKGIYIPAGKIDNYDNYITLTKETSVNAFVIDVKNDYGYLTFASTNPKLIEMGCVLDAPPIKDIKTVMSRLYEADIYPIARIVAFKDNVAGKKFPDRLVKDKAGNTYTNKANDTWLNPYDKRNWEYLLEMSKEAIKVGFKEIQFDYIRFHESMNEDTVILQSGVSKTEIITSFTKYMYENLKDYGVYVSADVFGAVITSKIDSEIVGQDFKELSKYLDYICPMVYPSHYARGTFGIEYPHIDAYGIILRSMELAQDEMKKSAREERRAIIRPWLQDFTMTNLKPYQPYGQKQIKAQIQGTYDAGLNEWIFWNSSGKYTQSGLDDK
jgi:hypothetical protein